MVSLSVPAALAALSSSRRGLSEPEAGRRRAAAGPNSLPRARRRPVWAELAAQLANMFAVVLLLAAGLTFLIYFLSVPRDAANLVLAFGILGVVVLNALIGFAQEHAAERTAEALQAMVPPRARGPAPRLVLGVLRDGELYGYETRQAISDRSAAVIEPGEGWLYPALHRLEAEVGATRHVQGQDALHDAVEVDAHVDRVGLRLGRVRRRLRSGAGLVAFFGQQR